MKGIIKLNSLLLICALFVVQSCNKSKRYSKRVDGNKWKVTELTVDGSAKDSLPTLLFKECDIYKESCEGSWIRPNNGRAQFAWQFRDKGKVLEISNQTDHAHTLDDVNASKECIGYTGIYKVKKSRLKELTIESSETNGYKGRAVKMVLEKE